MAGTTHRADRRAGELATRTWMMGVVCLAIGLCAATPRAGIVADGVGRDDPWTVVEGDAFTKVSIGAASLLNIVGGQVQEVVVLPWSNVVNVSGGIVGAIKVVPGEGRTPQQSVVNITGGQVGSAWQSDGGFRLSGGHVESIAFHSSVLGEISGGGVDILNITGGATVIFRGDEFNFRLGDIPGTSGTLTGMLADDSPLHMNFVRDELSTIRLVPEPGTIGAVLFTLPMMILRRMRRSVNNTRALEAGPKQGAIARSLSE